MKSTVAPGIALVFGLCLLIPIISAEPPEAAPKPLQRGFVYLSDVAPDIEASVRYASNQNFLGEPVDGYLAKKIVLTSQAAEALREVQEHLLKEGFSLKVFDAYRPQRAVNHFVRWGRDLNAQDTKAKYYPDVAKAELFNRGYIARQSGHSRGSTLDLTLIKLEPKKQEVDMGTPFDFFDRRSWPYSDEVTAEQHANRMRLRTAMKEHGFRPYDREWWHFTLINEPFPETYFDFPIK